MLLAAAVVFLGSVTLKSEAYGPETITIQNEKVEDGFRGNSFRYKDGVPVIIDEPALYSDFVPWSRVDGRWINTLGHPIPGAVEKGIDVSTFQGDIDWEKIKDSDVTYAILRCGYGSDKEENDDARWKRNAEECTRLGIPFGVYIYSYAESKEEAIDEANHVLRLIKDYDLSYPVYFDLEDEYTTGSRSNAEIAEMAKAFCEVIENAGYDTGIYANLYWFNERLTDEWFDTQSKWVAHYAPICGYEDPHDMWQCTHKGKMDGIEGYVDVNFTMDHQAVEEDVYQFVERLYTLVLDREPDPLGIEAWQKQLLDHVETGAQVAKGFVFSDEFKERAVDDADFIDIMYRTFLNRESDEAGKKDWMNRLAEGFSREYILKGFIESDEFDRICYSYAITRGSIELGNIQDQHPEITKYLARCYNVFLGRKPDEAGIKDWVEAFALRGEDPEAVTAGFVFSNEMMEKELDDEAFIRILYKGMFDRDADAIGLEEWLIWVSEGRSREEIFCGFANSQEFHKLIENFGL